MLELLQDAKPKVYTQLPAPKAGFEIICWAVTEDTFELKSSCPRCAYFYKTDEFFNLAYLLNYLNSGMADVEQYGQCRMKDRGIYGIGYEVIGAKQYECNDW